MIGIIDIGIGTPKSILNAFRYLNIDSVLINNPREVGKISKMVLPGVGNFGYYMSVLREKKFEVEIKTMICNYKIPFMGICVGAQALLEKSDECNNEVGLNIIPGVVKMIDIKENQKVPNVGWRKIEYKNKIFNLNPSNTTERYYFSHSYELKVKPEFIVAKTLMSGITAIIQKNNVVGVQFHPEKSGSYGLTLLAQFANWTIQ
jgi:glutamine amidotransferase